MNDIKQDETGRKFIEVKVTETKGFKYYIVNKDESASKGEIDKNEKKAFRISINNLILNGADNIEYIPDQNENNKGEFKFRYNDKEQIIKYTGRIIIKEDIEELDEILTFKSILERIDPTYSEIQENKNGQILVKFKHEDKEYLYYYREGQKPNFDEIKKNSILIEDFKIIQEITKNEKLNDLKKIEYQDYNGIKGTLEKVNNVINGINKVFKGYLNFNDNKPYTIKDIKQDENGGAYINVKMTATRGFRYYIFDKYKNLLKGKADKNTESFRTSIFNLITIRADNIEYIPDQNENNKGEFKFRYNNKEQIIKYTGKTITKKDIEEDIEKLDKVQIIEILESRNATDIIQLNENENGQRLIKFKYEDKEYLYYYTKGQKPNFDEVKKNSILIEEFKIIYEIIKKEKLKDSVKIEYQDYNEIKETLEKVNNVINGINEVFKSLNNKPYTIKDIKQDKNGFYIEVKMLENTVFKYYIVDKDKKVLEGKIDKNKESYFRTSIFNLITTRADNIEYIPNQNENNKGEFKFKYKNEIIIIKYSGQKIIKEDIEKLDKVQIIEILKSGNATDIQFENENGQILVKFKHEDKEYLYYYREGQKPNFDEVKKNSILIEDFKIFQKITKNEKLKDLEKIEYQDYNEIKETLKKVNNVIYGINKVFKDYLKYNNDKPYTIKDIRQNKDGKTYIRVKITAVTEFEYNIFDKYTNVLEGKISENKESTFKTSILNLNRKSANIEYIPDQNENNKGEFKFRYIEPGGDLNYRIIKYTGQEITENLIDNLNIKEDNLIKESVTNLDDKLKYIKVNSEKEKIIQEQIRAILSFSEPELFSKQNGNTSDEITITEEFDQGNSYIELNHKDVKYNYYFFNKNGTINDVNIIKEINKNIEDLKSKRGALDVEYKSYRNGYGMFKYKTAKGEIKTVYFNGKELIEPNKVITQINNIFNTNYEEKDIKNDIDGAYIDVEYVGVKIKQYFFDEYGNYNTTEDLISLLDDINIFLKGNNKTGTFKLRYKDKENKYKETEITVQSVEKIDNKNKISTEILREKEQEKQQEQKLYNERIEKYAELIKSGALNLNIVNKDIPDFKKLKDIFLLMQKESIENEERLKEEKILKEINNVLEKEINEQERWMFKRYKYEDIKNEEDTGRRYLPIKMNGVEYKYYFVKENGEYNNTDIVKKTNEYIKRIRQLELKNGKIIFEQDRNGYGLFKFTVNNIAENEISTGKNINQQEYVLYFNGTEFPTAETIKENAENLKERLNEINKVFKDFLKPYTIEDIKQDENGAYIEVKEEENKSSRKYIFNKEGYLLPVGETKKKIIENSVKEINKILAQEQQKKNYKFSQQNKDNGLEFSVYKKDNEKEHFRYYFFNFFNEKGEPNINENIIKNMQIVMSWFEGESITYEFVLAKNGFLYVKKSGNNKPNIYRFDLNNFEKYKINIKKDKMSPLDKYDSDISLLGFSNVFGLFGVFSERKYKDEVQLDKEGGAYINVTYRDIQFRVDFFNKDGTEVYAVPNCEELKKLENLRDIIDFLKEKRVENLQYKDNGGKGIFTFKYGGKQQKLEFTGDEIITKDAIKIRLDIYNKDNKNIENVGIKDEIKLKKDDDNVSIFNKLVLRNNIDKNNGIVLAIKNMLEHETVTIEEIVMAVDEIERKEFDKPNDKEVEMLIQYFPEILGHNYVDKLNKKVKMLMEKIRINKEQKFINNMLHVYAKKGWGYDSKIKEDLYKLLPGQSAEALKVLVSNDIVSIYDLVYFAKKWEQKENKNQENNFSEYVKFVLKETIVEPHFNLLSNIIFQELSLREDLYYVVLLQSNITDQEPLLLEDKKTIADEIVEQFLKYPIIIKTADNAYADKSLLKKDEFGNLEYNFENLIDGNKNIKDLIVYKIEKKFSNDLSEKERAILENFKTGKIGKINKNDIEKKYNNDYKIVIKKGNEARVTKISYEAGSDKNVKKIKIEFDNKIKGKKFIEKSLVKDIKEEEIKKEIDEFNEKNEGDKTLEVFLEENKEKLVQLGCVIKEENIEDLEQNFIDDLDNKNIENIRYDEENKNISIYYKEDGENKGIILSLRDKLNKAQEENLKNLKNLKKDDIISGKLVTDWLIGKAKGNLGLKVKINLSREIKYEHQLLELKDTNMLSVEYDERQKKVIVYYRGKVANSNVMVASFLLLNNLNASISLRGRAGAWPPAPSSSPPGRPPLRRRRRRG